MMDNDEFLYTLRQTPRTSFVDELQAKLDAPVEETPLSVLTPTVVGTAESFPPPSLPLAQSVKHPTGSRSVALVASLLLVMFLGIALAINGNQVETALPLAPMGIPVSPVISQENAAQLKHLAQLGKGLVFEAVWSPDGKWLIMPGSTGLWVYDANDLTTPFDHLYADLVINQQVVFSGNGHYLAFINASKIYMWDLLKWQNVPAERPGMKPAQAIALSHDGGIMAVAFRNSQISFYDTQANIQLGGLPVSGVDVLEMQFNADNTQLAFFRAGVRTHISIYHNPSGTWSTDETLGSEPSQFGLSEEGYVQSMNYNADGSRLSARIGLSVIVWDTKTREEVARFEVEPLVHTMSDGGIVRASQGDLAFSPDGKQLLLVDEQVRLWTMARSSAITLFTRDANMPYPGISSVHFNPDWTQMALVTPDGHVRIHDRVNDQQIATITDYSMFFVYDLTFSADGRRLASAGGAGDLLLWDISDLSNVPHPSPLLEPYQNSFSAFNRQGVAFSPTDQIVATFRQNTMRNIQLWNDDGTSAGTWIVEATPEDETLDPYEPSYISSLVYSADGMRLLAMAAFSPIIRLWDTTTGEVIRSFTSPEGEHITFGTLSPDGQSVAVALQSQAEEESAFSTIIISDAATGEPIQTLKRHKDRIINLIYSPDGKLLVSFSQDGAVYVWDLETGEIAYELNSAWASFPLTFSPDGRLIAGVTIDGKRLTIWDAATGNIVARLRETDLIEAIAFSADGRRLATGLSNGTIQIWGFK